MHVNTNQICAKYGVPSFVVKGWLRRGCPHWTHPTRFDPVALAGWLDQEPDLLASVARQDSSLMRAMLSAVDQAPPSPQAFARRLVLEAFEICANYCVDVVQVASEVRECRDVGINVETLIRRISDGASWKAIPTNTGSPSWRWTTQSTRPWIFAEN